MRWRLVAGLAALGVAAVSVAQGGDNPHRPRPTFDSVAPELPRGLRNAVLIVSKTNGWRHIEHIPHSNRVIGDLARAAGRRVVATENAAVFNDAQLTRFSVVVLNSASGDFLTADQRAALRRWIERGGGVVALHAAGDGSHGWPWWIDDVIGARFTGHPGGADHIQRADVRALDPRHPVMAGVRLPWSPPDEWYAFDRIPAGATLLAAIDEASYRPEKGKEMGALHPVIWAKAIGRGRIVYSALGHTPGAYDDPNYRRIIANALRWVAPRPQ